MRWFFNEGWTKHNWLHLSFGACTVLGEFMLYLSWGWRGNLYRMFWGTRHGLRCYLPVAEGEY